MNHYDNQNPHTDPDDHYIYDRLWLMNYPENLLLDNFESARALYQAYGDAVQIIINWWSSEQVQWAIEALRQLVAEFQQTTARKQQHNPIDPLRQDWKDRRRGKGKTGGAFRGRGSR